MTHSNERISSLSRSGKDIFPRLPAEVAGCQAETAMSNCLSHRSETCPEESTTPSTFSRFRRWTEPPCTEQRQLPTSYSPLMYSTSHIRTLSSPSPVAAARSGCAQHRSTEDTALGNVPRLSAGDPTYFRPRFSDARISNVNY